MFCCQIYAPIKLCRYNTCMRYEFCLSFLCMFPLSQKSLIQVSFRPTLSDQLIREEAALRLCEAAATGAEIQVRNAKKQHVLLVYYFQIFVSLDGIFITKLFPR